MTNILSYEVRFGNEPYGYYVIAHEPRYTRVVAGPFRTREDATARMLELSEQRSSSAVRP